jgi:hypothetical protein
VTKGIKTKKYYQRQGKVIDESFGKVENVVTVAPETDDQDYSPFSSDNEEEEDDAFSFDNWGGDDDDDDDDDW